MTESKFLKDARTISRLASARKSWANRLINNYLENILFYDKSTTLNNINGGNDQYCSDLNSWEFRTERASHAFREDPVAQKIRSIYANGYTDKEVIYSKERNKVKASLEIAHRKLAERTMTEIEYNFLLSSPEEEIIMALGKSGSIAYFDYVPKEFVK